MTHKAGFVNIIGNPNVGKSTLMNALVGEKLSIITAKAQTTRHRILGIVNEDEHQIIFSDTPGILQPAYQLQESMMDFVKSAFDDADILIYMVEIGEKELKNEAFFKRIINTKIPVILLINKKVLILKAILVSILAIVAILSLPILLNKDNTHFKHALEWNYFVGVILFYLFSRFFWRRTT